ncbi:SpoIIAA family protein [Hymenobacter latericus]|uniref:STAS/SEC14 domain-containing protein n=1 Tax=Hymenobacter sp. YIM 151858-1 TaxID=2987688 RepID=UPI00222772BF|nr:STAS/SEC14 domain-containing protein [Hymenobacter sp. YIM 151858-1]UYZ59897.1 STAS/SEC14 domain-containing protein [Hymenobacter sp. YIM 151858-1]
MLRAVDHPDHNLLTFIINGPISRADYDQVVPVLEQKIARWNKVNVCVEVRHFDGISLRALWEEIRQDIKHYKDFNRVAVITEDSALVNAAVGLGTSLTPALIKHFTPQQKQSAEDWARGQAF